MKRAFVWLFLAAVCVPVARAANWPERPTLHAVRASSPIVIDGDLSDAAWQAAHPVFANTASPGPFFGAAGGSRLAT